MPIYPGRREGTHRIVVWSKGKSTEAIVEGTADEARAREARMRLQLRGDLPTTRTPKSFGAFSADRYQPHVRTVVARSTWNRCRRYQLETLCRFFGNMLLTAISTADVEQYKAQRVAAGRRHGVVNEELKVLRAILRLARDEGEPCSDPKARSLPRQASGRVKFWTRPEVLRLLAAAARLDPPLEPLVSFLVNMGVRKSEAIAARWTWIDARARMLRIPADADWHPKSKKPREVTIPDVLLRTLRALPRRSGYVFPAASGGPFARFPDRRLARLLGAAGLQGSAHTARHTFASHFLAARPDLPELAAILGHSHSRVTELYTHLLPGHHEKSRNAVSFGGPLRKTRESVNRPAEVSTGLRKCRRAPDRGATMARKRAG